MTCAFRAFTKQERFLDLVESVQHCDICPRLCDRRKVLSQANGTPDSKVLFVAEAPGRLGADRTGVPLHGDRTGDNFEALLGNIGWRRENLFITNAVLCNPKAENGNNSTPTAEEVTNCSTYLEMVITLVSPDVIVTLGATALNAVGLLAPHGLELRSGVAQLVPWGRMRLFPLYHPGPRALVHRSLAKQRADFMLLSKAVDPVRGLIRKAKRRTQAPGLFPAGGSMMQQVARALLGLGGRMTYFKLTKLMYLVDLRCLDQFGYTVASELYLRQVDGPWPPDLNSQLEAMDGHEVLRFFSRRVPMVDQGPAPRSDVQLDDDILEVICEVHARYGGMTNAQIKAAAYRTAPMRFILEVERTGRKMVNKPVIYKGKTAQEMDETS